MFNDNKFFLNYVSKILQTWIIKPGNLNNEIK